MKISLNEKEVKEIIDSCDYQSVKDRRGKHNCTSQYIIFKKDNKNYGMWLSFSYNDGLQLYGNTITEEVNEVEKTIKVWEIIE